MILAIDTSNSFCSVCLYGQSYISKEVAVSNSHSEILPKIIEDLFHEANKQISDVTEIIVGVGPGTFTGLRIGMAFASGLASGLNLPLIGFSSFQAISLNFKEPVQIIADARRDEFYAGDYLNGTVLVSERIIGKNELSDSSVRLTDIADPQIAKHLIQLHLTMKSPIYRGELTPLYIRELAAKKISERY